MLRITGYLCGPGLSRGVQRIARGAGLTLPSVHLAQNWDGDTTPPAGWTFGNGYSVAPYSAAGGSSPNALRRAASVGGYDQAFYGVPDDLGGNLVLSASFAWDADPTAELACALIFRNQGGPGSILASTQYVAALSPNGTGGQANFSRWVNGSGSSVGTASSFPAGTFAANTLYRTSVTIDGPHASLRVQRKTDGLYLTTAGTWHPRPQDVAAFSDATIAGAGLVGTYMAGAGGANAYLDDFLLTALPPAPGLASVNVVFVGNSLVAGADCTPGNDVPSQALRSLGSRYAGVPVPGARSTQNLGIGGQSITLLPDPNPQGYTRLIDTTAARDGLLSDTLQNVLVVWEGTNELTTPPQTITGTQAAQNLRDYCLAARAVRGPNGERWHQVVVGTPLPRDGQPGVRSDYEAARQDFRAYVLANASGFCDRAWDVGGDATIGQPGQNLDTRYYFDGGAGSLDRFVHLVDAGAAIAARSLAAALLAL